MAENNMTETAIKLLSRGGTVIAFLCVALGACRVLAQESQSSVLELRIFAEQSLLKTGSDLVLNVELLNVSMRPVRVSPAGIASQVSFVNLPCSLDEGTRSLSRSIDPLPFAPQMTQTVIEPGQTFRKTIHVRLDKGFFSPGVYSMTIVFSGAFGGSGNKDSFKDFVKSNEILFSISENLGP